MHRTPQGAGQDGRREDGDAPGGGDWARADGAQRLEALRGWAQELGFSQIGVAGVDLRSAEPGLLAWLENGFHGSMDYMARHGLRRARPAELVPGTLSVITARMDYLPAAAPGPSGQQSGDQSGDRWGDQLGDHPGDQSYDRLMQGPRDWQQIEFERLAQPRQATVSLYARGRDYHKVMRARLQRLADRLAAEAGPLGHRVFTDSAPLLEVELATRSGLGWRGRHTLALSREGGSMFFLGEICVDMALPPTPPVEPHCGSCRACIDACPTGAIVGDQRLDARRCISYLTIEHAGPIDEALRPLIGNRIYGCDDCQLVCPWNKYAQRATLPDFDTREPFTAPTLLALWDWDEPTFLRATEGSAIRRIGHERWRRNLAVALGNAWRETGDPALAQALQRERDAASPLVREHIDWALAQRAAG